MIDYCACSENSAEQASTSGRRVTAFLRWVGTITLAASAISFMLQGLEDFVPGYRNWVISGFIVVLCICGLICGYLMKETRGARLFFGLATAFLTVQFVQISTLSYQYLVPLSEELQPIMSWWRVDPMPLPMFAVVVGASLILSALVVPTGFSMLARTQARRLSLGFLAGNSLLLVPTRNNFMIALASISLFLGLRLLTRRSVTEDPVHRTLEGLAALAIMWIPFAIIEGRGLFYPNNWAVLCVIFGISAVVLLIDVRSVVRSAWMRFLTQAIGTLAAIFTWLIVAQETSHRSPFIHGYEMLWVLLPLALLLHIISMTDGNPGSKYRAAAGLIAGYAVLGFLLANPGTVASFVGILTGIALAGTGLTNKEKLPFLSGIVCFASGVLFNLKFAFDVYQAFPWASSAALGLVVLLLASYIDSRERILLQKTWKAYLALKAWG